MAKTFGYGVQAFAGGFQTGLGLRTERMIADEKKRAEKLAKEKEENALNWLNSNKDSLMNIYTQSQEVRSKLLFESAMYKKEWTDYIRDVEDFIQAGDLEGLKHLNDMEEEKIKAERDMLPLGIRPENAFIGKYYSEESMNYAKKLQMGKLTNKPIGTKMYEEEFGELPLEVKAPTAADRKLDWAISLYEDKKINLDNLLKYFGMYITPEKRNTIQQKLDELDRLGATKEEKKNMLLGKTELTPTPTSVENIREDILNAPTLEDAKRMEKNHIAKYGDTTGIPNVEKFWSDERVRRLNTLKQGIDKLLDEKKRLKKGSITSAEVGFEIEDDMQKVEAVYQQLREEYMKYRKMLEKMGVDLSQFPELMSYNEYIKTDIKPGMGIFYPSTWGKQKPPVY